MAGPGDRLGYPSSMEEDRLGGAPSGPASPAAAADGSIRDAARVRLLTIEARDLERRLVIAEDRLAKFRVALRKERDKVEKMERQRSVRAAVAAGRVLRRLVRAARPGRGRGADRGSSKQSDVASRTLPAAGDRLLPHAYRSALLAAVRGETSDQIPLRVALIGDPALLPKAAASLRARGYVVSIPGERPTSAVGAVDVIVACSAPILTEPPTIDAISVWWEALGSSPSSPGRPRGWDIHLPASVDLAPALVEALQQWLQATRVGIRVATKTAAVALEWGDTYLAWDLADAFGKMGWPARVHYRDGWAGPAVGRSDVVIDLLGLAAPTHVAGRHRILWLISHPERADNTILARYDLVYVASDTFADILRDRLDMPVRPLHQATDAARFTPSSDTPSRDLIFVANWRPGRRVLEDLLPIERDLLVFGRGWTPDRLDPRFFGGEHIPNDELSRWYGSSAIVLNDHWASMRREGFISNRIYDAAATGALVISDDVVGLDDEFDGGVVGYRDRDHLRRVIDQYLADPALRRITGERARAAVLARHTFDHRVLAIAADIAALASDEPATHGATLPRDVRHE